MSADAIYDARGLHITFQRGKGPLVRAVDGVDLTWRRGETLGLVGESGCGKSTLARALLGLETPSAGGIDFDGQPVDRDLRVLRRRVQLIFQDPYQSLNPRRTVGASVQEGLAASGMSAGEERVHRGASALHDAGLAPADRFWNRFPARALGRPATARRDRCRARARARGARVRRAGVGTRRVRAHPGAAPTGRPAPNPLAVDAADHARRRHGLVALQQCRRDVSGPDRRDQHRRAGALADPQHPYTKALLAVVPTIDKRISARALLQGEPPDATAIPSGCRFHPRCPVAFERCPTDDPKLPEGERAAACWLVPGN